ncbi:MAG TPA: hypothetical protein VH257_10985 [Chloroflexota bacterium]|nr:hypothetical protein [Chloroflexota bacterium]
MRASNAQVELTLDLRFTPPDKVIPRLFGALERVGDDVTLLVLLRDTPEYAGVVASAYQALRAQGYATDSSRIPPGGQRLRVQRRRDQSTPRPASLPPRSATAPPPELPRPASLPPRSDSRSATAPPPTLRPESLPDSPPPPAALLEPGAVADRPESLGVEPRAAEPPAAEPPASDHPFQGQP